MNKDETAEKALTRAKQLMLSRQPEEAAAALLEAEQRFREVGNTEELLEVLCSESRVYLCLGLVPRALEAVEKATEIWAKRNRPIKDRRFLFHRGLVYLCAGKESEAHRDMTEYLELSEGQGDQVAQVRGHFYLALIFERHGEPCMAAAELEMGRDAARTLNPCVLYAGLTAFLAHLWIRRGQIEMAESLEREALQRIQGISNENGTSSRGMSLLVKAEIEALRANYETSRDTFDQSIKAFRHSSIGHYFVAVAHACYGETLLSLGNEEEGCPHLMQARSLFEKLSAASQVERMDKTMVGEAGHSCKHCSERNE